MNQVITISQTNSYKKVFQLTNYITYGHANYITIDVTILTLSITQVL